MNHNDQQFVAQKIRTQYMESTATELDALRALDTKVKRPVNVFSYILGSIGAVVMGSGMSLVMTDIGATLGLSATMPVGIVIGAVGLAMALVTYPLHNRLLRARKAKFADEIIALSDKIVSQ